MPLLSALLLGNMVTHFGIIEREELVNLWRALSTPLQAHQPQCIKMFLQNHSVNVLGQYVSGISGSFHLIENEIASA